MAQSLPTPGGDNGSWGTMLNGFLGVSLNSDGTVANSVISDAQVSSSAAINPTKISGTAEVQTNKGAASGYAPLNSSTLVGTAYLGTNTATSSNFLRGDGTWNTPPSASNATTSAPGLVELAGDLGGTGTTATAPTLSGTTNVESIIRANTLNQMGAPTATVNMNNQNFTNVLNPTSSSQVPTVASLVVNQYAYVVSGCVWTADSAGSTLNGSMTAGTVMIGGLLLTVSAITAHTFTASQDTYVDLTNGGSGTATVTFSGVANNAMSPAVAGTSAIDTCRIAIISTNGTSIPTGSNKINQGNPLQAFPATTAATTTVAAGSTGQNISALTSNQLSVASNSLAAAGCVVVDTTTGGTIANGYGGVITYTAGGGTTTLTGVTYIGGAASPGTVATGGNVAQICQNQVSDSLGNLIFPTTPNPVLIGYRYQLGAATFSTTAAHTLPDMIVPFIIPPGPTRRVKLSAMLVKLESASAAGQTITVDVYSCLVGGTLTALTGVQLDVAVAGYGSPVTAIGYGNLAPGSYTGLVQIAQSFGNACVMGVGTAVSIITVELV